MINIYIISLTKDVAKRKAISEKLDSLKLRYKFVDAIYGKSLSNEVFIGLNNKGKILRRGYKPTPGEVGCTLSHIKAIKAIQENDQSWSCILEDDAILDERFKNFINNFDGNKLSDDNLYILGGQNGLITEKFISKSIFSKIKISNQFFYKVVRSEKSVSRTCCYLVSRNFAKKYVEYSNKNFFLADDWTLLQDNFIFKEIYISNFVDHPVDLTLSNIEQERRDNEIVKTGFKSTRFFKILRLFYFIWRIFCTQLNRVRR